MWLNPQFSADLVTFIEEILNEELHFFAVSQVFYNIDIPVISDNPWKISVT